MRILVVLIALLMVSGALAQMSDDQASEEIRKNISLIRETFVVDEYSAEGIRGRDIYLEPPRTLVYEYEFNWALEDSILTREQMGSYKTVSEGYFTSIWCSEPTLKYWRDNDLHQNWLYRDSTGLFLFKVRSQDFDC